MNEEYKGDLLVSAIKHRQSNVVRELLSDGVDPSKFVNRELPLNIAIENGDVEMVKILLEHGVNCNPQVFYPLYPLRICVDLVIKSKNLDEENPYVIILQLLIKNGSDAKKLVDANYSEKSLSPVSGLSTLLRRYGWYDIFERVSHGGPP
ncbi:MAG: ankyrin repeat domain-containing protein [Candidatus Lokiarchaeota archaeon]|nr:ankyrin repeat domain-containing protein [Candidatus Lokiarchaeota archaeon]